MREVGEPCEWDEKFTLSEVEGIPFTRSILRDRLTCPAKFMSCFVYILRNTRNKYYTGITKLKPFERLTRHNKGDVKSTSRGIPWKLIYFEKFDNYTDAREKEKLIKSWHGGNAFKKFVAKAAGSFNGRTEDFGSSNLGSIPSPAALAKKRNLAG